VLLINNSDVMNVLDMRMTLDALDVAFHELTKGDAVGMGRIDLYVPSEQAAAPYYRWAVMAGGSRRDGYVCARMLSDMIGPNLGANVPCSSRIPELRRGHER